jgi:hypothetical protein
MDHNYDVHIYEHRCTSTSTYISIHLYSYICIHSYMIYLPCTSVPLQSLICNIMYFVDLQISAYLGEACAPIYIYIYMYIYICIYIYIYTCIYIYIYMYISIYIYMYVYMYIHVYIYIPVHARAWHISTSNFAASSDANNPI